MEKLVFSQNGKAMTSSWLVAKKFEKNHNHVMRDIRNLIEGVSKIGYTPVEFIQSTYRNPQNGVEYPLYIMDEDAFSLLVMGFTGEMALKFKLDYIAQFRAMREYLKKQMQSESKAIVIRQLTPEQEEKIKFADACIESDVRWSFGKLARRIITNNGANLTRKQLIYWLKDNGYLCDSDDVKECPTQWAIDMGYMMICHPATQERKDRDAKKRQSKGKPTPLGAQHLINLLTRSLPYGRGRVTKNKEIPQMI